MSGGARDRADLRVGVIGYGLGGSAFHAPVIAGVEGMRLAAVVTSDPERARRAAADHPGARVFSRADDLLADPAGLDLVVIATPNRTHVPLAEAAIRAGLAVVVDKPLAPTAAEGTRLAEEAERRGVLLSVYQNRRWDGDFLTLRALLDEGALGEPTRFESRFERWRPVPKPGWRQDPAPEAAGGLLFDLGAHLVDQALLLFGPAAGVYAELDRRVPGSEVDDDAFVAITHASGVRSHLWMSSLAAQEGPRFRVLGTRAGYVKWGTDPQEAALRGGDRPGGAGWGREPEAAWGTLGAGDDLRRVPTRPGDYPAFYRGIARALRDGAPPPVDPRDAVAALRVIEAARRSAAEGRVVELGG